ncbi:hypothetical protein SDC9_149588 [bioreactor metagenome]|uniref:Uncharacterized protein n=1 Tax=bioreactor metagenome TaxID=1076179 RepID=A0A645EM65_9ZZZZ
MDAQLAGNLLVRPPRLVQVRRSGTAIYRQAHVEVVVECRFGALLGSDQHGRDRTLKVFRAGGRSFALRAGHQTHLDFGGLRIGLSFGWSGEDDGQVGDCQEYHGRDSGHGPSENARHVSICGDDRVDGVRRHRHAGSTDEQRPRVPGGAGSGQGDDGDRGDDDDAVHDQRPRPRLPRPDPRAARQVGQGSEGEPERAHRDEHGPRDRGHDGPATPSSGVHGKLRAGDGSGGERSSEATGDGWLGATAVALTGAVVTVR